MGWRFVFVLIVLCFNLTYAYPSCTHCSMIDQAWLEYGQSNVFIPGTGLVPYTTVYPSISASASNTGTSTMPSISSSGGKAVYGASSTCAQTTSTVVKGQQGNSRLNKYADEWSNALVAQGLVGTTWIGVMDHNGRSDSQSLSVPGRLTIIFAPCTTNFNSPIEIMYYWHGIKGFGYETISVPYIDEEGKTKYKTVTFNDFNERLAPQSKTMSGQGRNFVLVIPEMPWSGGDQKGYGSRNTGTRSTQVFNGDDNFGIDTFTNANNSDLGLSLIHI